MPKLIDYPRTSYAGAWEVADVVDDTGGKCALDTCARKLNRKVSGSFKAIIGSAVKFGLLTSKRELLTTTTLFRRIKHAYDKQEELLFHREAFLTPPLFTQLCRKFRSRELPVQMLDIMLIREFDVEEINAQGVAKAFVEGARMVGLLDERNVIADIDQLAAQQPPRRELASPELSPNSFRAEVARSNAASLNVTSTEASNSQGKAAGSMPEVTPVAIADNSPVAATHSALTSSGSAISDRPAPLRGADAVANLFGLSDSGPISVTQNIPTTQSGTNSKSTGSSADADVPPQPAESERVTKTAASNPIAAAARPAAVPHSTQSTAAERPMNQATHSQLTPDSLSRGFRIELSGPGLNTVLDVQDEDDLALARVLLDKIGRQLNR